MILGVARKRDLFCFYHVIVVAAAAAAAAATLGTPRLRFLSALHAWIEVAARSN